MVDRRTDRELHQDMLKHVARKDGVVPNFKDVYTFISSASIVRIRYVLLLDCQGRSWRKGLRRIVGCWLFGNNGVVSHMEIVGCLSYGKQRVFGRGSVL